MPDQTQQRALQLLKKLKEDLQSERADSQETYNLSIEAAEQFAKAFDVEQERGLSFGDHDKYLAMAYICRGGVHHSFPLEDCLVAINKYIDWIEVWIELSEQPE